MSQERTGWRDLELNDRHRQWGFNCPAFDLDFIMVEYDNREPIAFVEYKAKKLPDGYLLKDANIEVLWKLARLASRPAFIVEYYKQDGVRRWAVTGIDKLAANKMSYFTKTMQIKHRVECTELEYVSFLYWLRGREMPPQVASYIQENSF
jgi:hypothetical protein